MIYLKDKPIIMIQRFQITQHIIKQEKEQTPTPKEQGGKKKLGSGCNNINNHMHVHTFNSNISGIG